MQAIKEQTGKQADTRSVVTVTVTCWVSHSEVSELSSATQKPGTTVGFDGFEGFGRARPKIPDGDGR